MRPRATGWRGSGGLGLQGAPVTRVQDYITNAKADLANGDTPVRVGRLVSTHEEVSDGEGDSYP